RGIPPIVSLMRFSLEMSSPADFFGLTWSGNVWASAPDVQSEPRVLNEVLPFSGEYPPRSVVEPISLLRCWPPPLSTLKPSGLAPVWPIVVSDLLVVIVPITEVRVRGRRRRRRDPERRSRAPQ